MGQGSYIVVQDGDGNMLATSLYHTPKPDVLVRRIKELVRTGGKHGGDLWSEVLRGRVEGGWRSIDEDGRVETFADAAGSYGPAPDLSRVLSGHDGGWTFFFDQDTGGLIKVVNNGWELDVSMFAPAVKDH